MNDSTQTGVAMAAIAAVCTIVGQLFGWLRDRDKLHNDKQLTEQSVEIASLKSQNTAQAKQMSEQDTEIAELKRTHADCESQHRDTSARLAALERALADHLNRGTAPRPALPPTV